MDEEIKITKDLRKELEYIRTLPPELQRLQAKKMNLII